MVRGVARRTPGHRPKCRSGSQEGPCRCLHRGGGGEKAALAPFLGKGNAALAGRSVHVSAQNPSPTPPHPAPRSLRSSAAVGARHRAASHTPLPPRPWAQGVTSATGGETGLCENPGHQHCTPRSPPASTPHICHDLPRAGYPGRRDTAPA